MLSFPVQMIEFTTKGGLPLLNSVTARTLMVRLLEFYRQIGRFQVFAYCVYPKGFRFILKEGPGYELFSALEALRGNSEDMVNAQLVKEGKPVDGVWHGLYRQKTLRNGLALQYELDELRHLPVHLGLAQHPAEYAFSNSDLTAGLGLDQLVARG